jgi:hypothetical protein
MKAIQRKLIATDTIELSWSKRGEKRVKKTSEFNEIKRNEKN